MKRDNLLKRYTILVALFLCFIHEVGAKTKDSIRIYGSQDFSHYTPKGEISYAGVPLILSGFIVKGVKKDFREVRNNYDHKFKSQIDNYTQYLPLVTTWGLKACGVEGRSSWGRLLVSNAFSAVLMAGLVNTMKYTIQEKRPDGSTANSFPSGHTATAFMCATILHKEYGMTRSPWYSVGGYTIATLTGFMRVLNNRHWISDVLVGAGIGILSADLGYMFTDLIFKKKGLLRGVRSDLDVDLNLNPSFFGLYGGVSFLSSEASVRDLEENLGLRCEFGTGTTIGLEGAYFLNKHWGFGGRVRLTTFPMKLFDNETGSRSKEYQGETLGVYGFDLGAYFNIPLSSRFNLGMKVLAGPNFSTNTRFYYLTENEETHETEKEEFLLLSPRTSFRGCVGIATSFSYGDGIVLRFFVDYDRMWHHYDLTWFEKEEEFKEIRDERGNSGIFTVGASMNLSF